jgi:DmsE family decaheme c-type cytochrome
MEAPVTPGRFQTSTPARFVVMAALVWMAAVAGVRARSVTVPAAAGGLPPIPFALSQAPTAPAPAPAASQGTPTYMGNANCLGCHDNERHGYELTPHGQAADARTPAAKQGCETCHGPGSRHAEDPDNVRVVNNFATMTAAETNATCTTCHNRGEHALWDGSEHERRDVTCTSCHSIHKSKSESGFLKAATETVVCADCHRDKAARVDRSGHMPLREGKMACSTCHNPHGSTNVKLLTRGDSVAELCTTCHADKRGPFLNEHAPSRDGCVTCHDPHGSSNERMLVARPPMLCQRCHVAIRHPSTIYDEEIINQSSARIYARSCVTCHATIHGSNHPSGRFFLR